MTTDNELLPCPFCGAKVVIEYSGDFMKVEHRDDEGCFLGDLEEYFSRRGQIDEVIAAWNTRAHSSPKPDASESFTHNCQRCERLFEANERLLDRLERNMSHAFLDPDMPDQELRLHMGELTADEMRVARAAIRWANSVSALVAQKMGE